MKIADGVAALELRMEVMGNVGLIYPTLLWDDNDVILVDTGVPGQLDAIRAEMESAGVAFDRLNKVIITHQDIDHIGSLPQLVAAAAKVDVLADAVEKPYIQGEKPLIKMTPERVAKMVESLPEAQRARMQAFFANPPHADVDATIKDGERLPYCGGITVIGTPGHTPGHVSLYHHASKTLITGDALTAAAGRLSGPNPQATPDMVTAVQSLKKLLLYDIQTAICYHGGVCRGDIQRQLAALAG